MSATGVGSPPLPVALPGAGFLSVAGIAGIVATKMGCKLVKSIEKEKTKEETEIEIPVKNTKIMQEFPMEEQQIFALAGKDISMSLKVKESKRVFLYVRGKNKSEEELKKIGEDFICKLRQQYAYSLVVNELKKKGFVITEEEVAETGQIRVLLRKI